MSEGDKNAKPPGQQVRSIDSRDLFQGQRLVQIDHKGEVYRLLITKSGKLILQK